MKDFIIGIDLGTSSIKAVCTDRNGIIARTSASYSSVQEKNGGPGPVSWWDAFCKALQELSTQTDLKQAAAIALDGQVGTYVLFDPGRKEEELTAVSWRDSGGQEQLDAVRSRFCSEYFIRHISMPHPSLVSYPIPRMLWFRDHLAGEWDKTELVLAPKDYIYYKLTGLFASDPYSWRGLANLDDCSFHEDFLKELGLPKSKLPPLYRPDEAPGHLTAGNARKFGLKDGIPVFIGCNDFFASLLGMGIYDEGQCFDMTGTSEHVGVITGRLSMDTNLVCGPYLNGIIHYGVTANSGASMDWAFRTFCGGKVPDIDVKGLSGSGRKVLPLFLPYLQGERAPVWDTQARGVFFGLDGSTTKDDLVYSVLEGVVFSLYHIWEGLNVRTEDVIRVAGGAAFDDRLNLLKASLFGVPFEVMKERDSAALGAAALGAQGIGWSGSCRTAVEGWTGPDHIIRPDAALNKILIKRFEIYKSLYPSLKESFNKWGGYRKEISNGI